MDTQGVNNGLAVLAREHLAIEGEMHRLVTFLNRNLKTRGLIFGLSRAEEGGFLLTIYAEPSIDYYHRGLK